MDMHDKSAWLPLDYFLRLIEWFLGGKPPVEPWDVVLPAETIRRVITMCPGGGITDAGIGLFSLTVYAMRCMAMLDFAPREVFVRRQLLRQMNNDVMMRSARLMSSARRLSIKRQ